jgi:hypothetical protein
MKLLAWITEGFITVFGITRPRPEQQRVAQIVIGGFLLAFLLVIASLLTYFVVEMRAHPR